MGTQAQLNANRLNAKKIGPRRLPPRPPIACTTLTVLPNSGRAGLAALGALIPARHAGLAPASPWKLTQLRPIGFVPQSASAAGETPDKSHQNLAVLDSFQRSMNRPAASQKGGQIRPRYIIGLIMRWSRYATALVLALHSAAFAADSVAPLGTYTSVERHHWAFRPRAHPEIPRFSDAADRQWAATPIDALILARLKKESLNPSTPADRATLIRRV